MELSVVFFPLDENYFRLTRLNSYANLVHGEVYSIQHYVIKFVSELRQAGGFLRVLRYPVSSTNKSDRHDITEILLKVALNTIILTLNLSLEKITVTSHLYSIEDIIDYNFLSSQENIIGKSVCTTTTFWIEIP
jgi:hypothetical protein